MNEIIENKKKSEILAEKIATLNYGDIITHKQMRYMLRYGFIQDINMKK